MLLSPTQRRLTVLALTVLIAPALVSVLLAPTPARGQGGEVVISQVYAGG